MRLYRLAANQGYALAQNNLGVMYAKGQGVPQDYVQASMWFNLSMALGNQTAATYRYRAAALMTPAQIAEAEKLAREWNPGGHWRAFDCGPSPDPRVALRICAARAHDEARA